MAKRKKQGTWDNPRRLYLAEVWSTTLERQPDAGGEFQMSFRGQNSKGYFHTIYVTMTLDDVCCLLRNVFRAAFKGWKTRMMDRARRLEKEIGSSDD